jgi:hypothetical protein
MYEVFTKDDYSLGNFQTLDSAMKMAKAYGEFVVIKSDTMEIAGKFGVSEPDPDYSWSKEYSIGRRKKEWKRDETKNDR